MHRTQRRPLPTGRDLAARRRWSSASCCRSSSIVLLAATTTLLAAALAAAAIFYYAVLYTVVLKRHTRRSTEFGGVPGAAPVLIGWAAVTGSLDWPAVVVLRRRLLLADAALLGAGHALPRRLRAGRRPDAAGGRARAVGRPADRRLGLGDRRRLAAAVAGGPGYGIGWIYTAAAAGLGAWFVARGAPPARAASSATADTKPMQLFHVSISYLALLSIAIIVDVLI